MLDPISSRFAPLPAIEPRKPATAGAQALSAPSPKAKTAPANGAEAGDVARQLSQSAPVNSSRVAELRQAMQAGNFPVQASRIAEAMIASLKA